MRKLNIRLLWALMLLLPISAVAVPLNYVEGTHYQPTKERLAPVSNDKNVIEVVEIFSYTCPHCFHFDPMVTKWAKSLPANVKFIRVPAIFRDSWLRLAKVFYAAKSMGVQKKLHPLIFNAIHVKRMNLTTRAALLDFVASQGIDRTKFANAMDSFSVKAEVKRAMEMSQNSGITGVPSMIVNGEYMTDAPMAGSYAKMLKVVDFLVDKAAAERHITIKR